MDRQYWTPATKQTKRILLGALIAASMSGCATQRGVQIASDTQKATSFVAAETVSTNTRPEAIAYRSVETPVQLAGFNDGMVVASPAAFTLPQDNDGELGLDSEEADVSSRSFSDFLQLDPPEEDGERGSQGDGESDEDEVRNTDSQTPPLPDSPTPSSPTAPVEFFVNEALSRHPKILAARQRVAAASNVIPQAKALPDPTFNNTFWPFHDNALQTAGGRVGNQMSVNQKVPFPDKLKTKAIIASREVQIAQTEVDGIAREITESVRLAYYEVWFATRAIAIIEETKDLVADLTDVAEARYRSGGSQQDVLRAQLETDRLDEQLITLRRQKQVAQADLATLLQQPVDLLPEATDELGITDTPQQIEELIALAEQCNPKLRGLAWEIQRDRDKERLACLQQYPDFNVGLSWGLISDGHDVISPVANGNDNLSISFGTTLPIWREKINAGIREAAHRRSSTTRRLEAERDELYGKIRRLIVQADALAEQRDIYENRIIPRTEGTLELSIADYRGKRTDFFTLIETYRELLMFETQLARIDATLAGTIAQLDRTVGCPQ
ncbi:TolC family protein [Rhodopirellula sp. JC740]|uniref:Outer membrane efflux protein n=5 Tax=Planctomycetia TaxID=203683 RepID=A0A5C6FNM0_9PLAN|nr:MULTISPECIES: TolC family protein [Rhodopirellula]TWU62248.1 Outer membrane efflux protein [Crateriforma conspicua]EGF27289.1 Outer membrane efflux protein [Rhodopirellula baltica WH47]ELP30004.1 Outer membrane efflux protein [Rhodopirellula baltica SWK14]MCC9642939.1 TolC family protein [Rhodopirellula sp. JC740]MCC9656313.1 TolC family protein [Rhodopirellula sp. JC737]